MALTDVACRTAKPGVARAKLSDGGGLQLWVQPNGSRLWQLAYRYQGKQRQLALGPYPQVTLAAAREKREEAKKLLRDGIDPTEQGASGDALPVDAGDTFKQIAFEYVAKRRREGLAETASCEGARQPRSVWRRWKRKGR